MAYGTEEVFKVTFETDPTSFKQEIKSTENSAKMVAESITKHMASAGTSTETLIKNTNIQLSKSAIGNIEHIKNLKGFEKTIAQIGNVVSNQAEKIKTSLFSSLDSITKVLKSNKEKISLAFNNVEFVDTLKTSLSYLMVQTGTSVKNSIQTIFNSIFKHITVGVMATNKVASNLIYYIKTAFSVIDENAPKSLIAIKNFIGATSKAITSTLAVLAKSALVVTDVLAKGVILTGGLVVGMFKIGKSVKDYISDSGQYFRNLTDKIYESSKASVKFIGMISGITSSLQAAHKLTNLALKVTGVAVVAGVITGAFASFKQNLQFLNVLTDTLFAALEPLQVVLYELAVQIAPKIVSVISPFILRLAKFGEGLVKNITQAGPTMTKFEVFIEKIYSAISSLSDIIFDTADILIKNLGPVLTTILEDLIVQFTLLTDSLFPKISSGAKAILPIISKFLTEALPSIRILLKVIVGGIIDLLSNVGKLLSPMIEDFGKMGTSIFPSLEKFIKSLGPIIKDAIPTLINLLKIVSSITNKLIFPVVGGILKIVLFLIATIIEGWGKIFNYFAVYGDNVLKVINEIINGIATSAAFIYNTITGTIMGIYEYVIKTWDDIKNYLGLEYIGHTISGIFAGILAAVMSPLEALKKLINISIIEPLTYLLNYDIPLVGKLSKYMTPPKPLAEGGIVSRPIVAMIGEKGPEAVIPLKTEMINKIFNTTTKVAQETDIETTKQLIMLLKEMKLLLMDIRSAVETKSKPNKFDTNNVKFTMQGFVYAR